MSYPSSSSMSYGVASGQSGRYIIQPMAIQSAISAHQHKSAQIDKVARGDKLALAQVEYEAAVAAYFSGQISGAEFDAASKRARDFRRAHSNHLTDFHARTQAGQTQPSDFFKEFYGCTDEEAEDHVRCDANLADTRDANEARNRSRILQKSRYGQGH